MKVDFTLKTLGNVLCGIIKKGVPDKKIRKQIKTDYKQIMANADDIGNKNNLITSYALAGFFVAMNRYTGLNPQQNYEILDDGMRNSKLLKMFLGNANSYFSQKKMDFRRKWAKESHDKKYKNDWVIDFVEKADDFEFGLDYKECGVCKLCKDLGCFELAKYLCKLDFMLVEIIGIKLDRTMTLADGNEKCDFRFKRK